MQQNNNGQNTSIYTSLQIIAIMEVIAIFGNTVVTVQKSFK